MPLQINGSIQENRVSIVPESEELILGRLVIEGSGNTVEIGPRCSSASMDLQVRAGSSIQIGQGCRLGYLMIYADRGASVEIGDNVAFNGRVRLLLHERGRITIGSGSLFAGEVDVTISDMHSIVDLATGARTNPPCDISIGERVWIGQRAMILKGARIGSGAVIGAGAIVTRGTIPENCVAAGNPAQIIKSNATWRFELL